MGARSDCDRSSTFGHGSRAKVVTNAVSQGLRSCRHVPEAGLQLLPGVLVGVRDASRTGADLSCTDEDGHELVHTAWRLLCSVLLDQSFLQVSDIHYRYCIEQQ